MATKKELLIEGTKLVKKILKNKKITDLTNQEKIILTATLEVMKDIYNQ